MGPEPLLRTNAEGTRVVLEACRPPASSASCTPPRWRRSGPRGAGRARRAPRAHRAAGHPLRRRQARRRGRGAAGRGARARRRARLPRARARRRRRPPLLDRGRAPLHAAAHPGLRRRRDQRGRRRGRRRGHSARRRARRGRRALHPRHAQLHVERLFGELEQMSGIEAPALRLPVAAALALAEASARAPGPTLVTPSEVRAAAQWWTYRSAKARRDLGWTTRPHEETVEDTVRYHEERLGDRLRAPAAASRCPGASSAGGAVAGAGRSSTAASRRRTGCARAGGWRAS